MELEPNRNSTGAVRGAPTWIWALIPPLAWAAQFETIYVLAPPTRQTEHVAAIRWVSLAALVAAAASTWAAYLDFQSARRRVQPYERRSRSSVWLASAAIGMGLFFCLVIMTTVLVTWFVSPED